MEKGKHAIGERNKFRRSGGILLHPTSLPSEYGIGDLGPSIYKFMDFLAENNQKLWQILPLGPTGYGNSPYQCLSAFAGNHLLISIEKLLDQGLISKIDCKIEKPFSSEFVDFNRVIILKNALLRIAYNNFTHNRSEFESKFFTFERENQYWLDKYALYMSLKIAHDQTSWIEWPDKFHSRNESAINEWRNGHLREIEYYKFIQFLFYHQWSEVKLFANKKNISIIGDIPIFVALDSSDVWSHPELYHLDEMGNPIYVAGVPPDYFSETGQRWGNPLYRWDKMKENDYRWWIQRVKHVMKYVDIVRIDHFRGFEAYWRIPANEPTAVKGKWIKGPGADLFDRIKKILGDVPIIAEDLGVITPEVDAIRDQFGYPGMKILHYAFDQDQHSSNKHLPHNYHQNFVVYTGTHDNNTTLGWYNSTSQKTKDYLASFIGSTENDVVAKLIRLAWSSVAIFAIIPLQDLLRLDESARMNLPGTLTGNWQWRFSWEQINREKVDELAIMSEIYGRCASKDN